MKWIVSLLPPPFVLLSILALASISCGTADRQETLRLGTKNFTEQLILGELMSQLIEARTDLKVDRIFNLGGTMICHNALVTGEIDMYPEYTGTALTAVLGKGPIASPDSAYAVVASAYADRYACEWLVPFGFNNTYAITVRRSDAKANTWKSISDLAGFASGLRAGFTAEFSERRDGYPGMREAYGFGFGIGRDLDPGLMYKALAQGEVDLICAFSTDGRIPAYDLEPLEDDRGFFPPYYAAPVARVAVLIAHPEIREALGPLAGAIDNVTMQHLNHEVDEKKRPVAIVAARFLKQSGILGEGG